MPRKTSALEDNPLWYKDAVIYQLHVKTFADGNGDGIGDFRGLIGKLDYLADLGVTVLWLLPFYPSPLRDDGYDISDYVSINPDYGTLRDFREFLREAHARGLRVITELVLNHTSDQHPWFQRARRAKPGSAYRDFYVWSSKPDRYADARIIFLDFEPSNWAWDPVAKAYYWHRFYSHQPDLNFENPLVQKELIKAIDFWYGLGVDGLRLDAVPYLYEREGTNCENLPETHAFLKKLRSHIDRTYRNKMLLAEANQWPEDAVEYFGDGDESHMAFHFPVMPRIFMSLQMEDRFPVVDILTQTPEIPSSCQWAMFLRNHDELTLEMVTDEERDYMYKVYASDPKARINLGIRRRLAPLVGNSRRKMELMNILLFSLPGTPIIYYGDEIGMGDNYYLGDRNGVRTPMQWSSDRNAGFSRANPQRLFLPVIIDPEYHYEAVNVENQQANPSSLLWWMKRVISMRNRFRSFGQGAIEFVGCSNPKVLAFVRHHEDEAMLVVINLSRFSQVVELDLARFAGYTPEEVFGQSVFPAIREAPYVLTLGFHDYFWFALRKEEETFRIGDFMMALPEISVTGEWYLAFHDRVREQLEKNILPMYISGCRWFGGKGRKIRKIRITETVPFGRNGASTYFLFLLVGYTEGVSETYLLPVSFADGDYAQKMLEERPHVALAKIRTPLGEGIMYDAAYNEAFHEDLLTCIVRRRSSRGMHGELAGYSGKRLRQMVVPADLPLSSQLMKGEQSNSSFLFDNRLILKIYRKIEEGTNPDLEICRFLSEKTKFSSTPPFAGAIEYRRPRAATVSIGHLQGFVPNQGDAWTFTLDSLGHYFERVLAEGALLEEPPGMPETACCIEPRFIPDDLRELIGGFYIEMSGLLGRRTAELHRALSSSSDPVFAPEPFSMLYQRSLYQSMRNLTVRVFHLLRTNLRKLSADLRGEAEKVIELEDRIMEQFQTIMKRKVGAMKIRYHGDYHLGQVLFTGNDFVILDFEGEPARPLSERRLKRSPLRDVAGMIRSYQYATYTMLMRQSLVRTEDIGRLRRWADLWYRSVSGVFLSEYRKAAEGAVFFPKEGDEQEMLLRLFLLEKAVYELGYELNNRPDWVAIPLRGISDLLSQEKEEHA